MLTFRIHYWLGSLPLALYDVKPHHWQREHECDDKVVFLEFFTHGRSIGRSSGVDNYAFDGERLWLWSDPENSWAGKDRIGTVHRVDMTVANGEPFNELPTLDCLVRRGVMLPEDQAREVGLV